jgi:HEXXH motif-containing protein
VNYLPLRGPDRFVDAPRDHHSIQTAENYVRCWPECFRQFQQIMHTFHPWLDTQMAPRALGSASHSLEQYLGSLYATVNDPHGLAQAFVHEMAHNKLRAIGIQVEAAERFILNPPEELFDSPIRKDQMRPMTAVFHAQYSFMHVTMLDILNIETAQDESETRLWVRLLRDNLPRMLEGDLEIRSHVRLDEEGGQLMLGFFDWSDRVLEKGTHLIQRYTLGTSRDGH